MKSKITLISGRLLLLPRVQIISQYLTLLPVVCSLVEKGHAKLDVVDGIDMKSPIHLLSTQAANDSLIKFMLDHGANINATDVKNNTAIHIAISNRTFNIVTLLIERKADINVQGEKGQTRMIYQSALLTLQRCMLH